MKKTILLAAVTLFVISCTKKMAPAKTETPATPAAAANPAAQPQPGVNAEAPKTETPPTGDNDPSAALTAGKLTFEGKCGRCHGLKNTTDYTADRWVKLVDWMAPKARLTDDEKKNVLAYVQANAKKG